MSGTTIAYIVRGGKCILDLTGQRYGRLTVISEVPPKKGLRMWQCQCACGRTAVVSQKTLRKGTTQSCGCYARDLRIKKRWRHGMSHSRIHNIWWAMVQRCTDAHSISYPRYGARGITICEKWLSSFEEFYKDMGDPPFPSASIERSDNNGNYCPENCHWATATEQANNRRSNRMITYQGKTQTMTEWSRETGIKASAIAFRLRSGWSIDDAMTRPLRHR